MKTGWYLRCSYCDAQVYVSRWRWMASLLFWSMRRSDPEDSAWYCGLNNDLKTVTLEFRAPED